MKNKFMYAAIISAALLCSSCGSKNDVAENNNTINEEGQNNELSLGNSSESIDIGTPEDEKLQTDETGNGSLSGNITIETQTIEDNDTAEDGTSIYVMSYVQPTVTIEGNDVASEKINADLQTRIDTFTADDTLRNEAKEFYDFSLTEKDSYFNEYSETLDFEAVRSDTSVISFITTVYSYAGGAHGNYGRFGINYNARTGELISFSELTDDADKFHSDTLEYNRELASTDEYKERMFEEDFLGDGELENVLYADEKWYLSDEGLVFISNPYELGPYAAGVIEFVIPYDTLMEMGLKEEYGYQ